jgi:uncharacterized protein YndB with AHSA1/START domain/DNA-binding transcriptional ArsR family regulator
MLRSVKDVFKALADPTRRKLLDALRKRDGQTLTELEQRFEMTRFGIMKHLRILEREGLVVTHRSGREKLHYLNPTPIRSIHDRWISKYAEPWMAGLSALKRTLEEPMEKPKHVYQIWIRTTPERLWDAITKPDETARYFFGTEVQTDWQPGSPIVYAWEGKHELDGTVLEVDPPRKLVTTFIMTHDEAAKHDPPTRVTWQIEPAGEMCKLTVIHDDFHEETATFRSVGRGWPYILSNLKTWIETGTPLPQMTKA